nr:Rieske (2Fe-2S) protein [Brevibacterium sp. RIT 803]
MRSTVETNRRTIIKSASVVGGVAVVGSSAGLTSACTSEEPDDSQSDSGADATVEASEVPVGSGTVVDETYVITQPKEGEFHAFSSVCTHQGCQVRTVTEKEIVCPCHSSRFSTTSGEVTDGPATEPLPEYSVSEAGGKLTISGSS